MCVAPWTICAICSRADLCIQKHAFETAVLYLFIFCFVYAHWKWKHNTMLGMQMHRLRQNARRWLPQLLVDSAIGVFSHIGCGRQARDRWTRAIARAPARATAVKLTTYKNVNLHIIACAVLCRHAKLSPYVSVYIFMFCSHSRIDIAAIVALVIVKIEQNMSSWFYFYLFICIALRWQPWQCGPIVPFPM